MKKNTMMRVASVLLMAVLLTTSVISGTFAKYATKAAADDVARVAKWGVVLTGSGSLFGKNYEIGANSIPSVKETASDLSVKSSNTSNVVAPGTQSENGLAFSLDGKPEVRTHVLVIVSAQDIYLKEGVYGIMKEEKVNATDFAAVKDKLYTKDGSAYTKLAGDARYDANITYYISGDQATLTSAYYPVVYANANTNADSTQVTEIARKITGNIEAGVTDDDETTAGVSYTVKKEYDPNTDLATAAKLSGNNISWKWAYGDFEQSTVNDSADTILGNLAAKMLGDSIDVVMIEGDTVTVLKVDETTGIVSNGNSEVGSVLTKFEIEIAARQVD